MHVTYVEKLPSCDLCSADAHFDALTVNGLWAYLCDLCFGEVGVGLGTGRGQILKVREEHRRPTIDEHGLCSECGRKYSDIADCPCPSDDCPSHDRMLTVEVTSFDKWMLDVDFELERAVSLCSGDLPDVPYYDWYERGIVASDAAEGAMERAID